MKNTDVLLVGAGALGSRHLQALAADADVERVSVVEPNTVSQSVALERWRAVEGHETKSLRFVAMEDIGTDYSSAVIATPATGRLDVLCGVLGTGVKHILCEKVLFQSVEDLVQADKEIDRFGADVRVNHVYRYASAFEILRKRTRSLPISGEITIGGDGMGCNLIHHLDLFEFLSGENINAVDVSIDMPPHQSKRGNGYMEFTGRATAKTGSGNTLSINYANAPASAPAFHFSTPEGTIDLSEQTGEIITTIANFEESLFASPRVSELTGRILSDQIAGLSLLPNVKESTEANRLMLVAFNTQIFGHHADDMTCPIT